MFDFSFGNREFAIADYLENNGYANALEAFKQDAKIVSQRADVCSPFVFSS